MVDVVYDVFVEGFYICYVWDFVVDVVEVVEV